MDKRLFLIIFSTSFLHAGRLLNPGKEIDSLLLRLARIKTPFYNYDKFTTSYVNAVDLEFIDIITFFYDNKDQLAQVSCENKFRRLENTVNSFVNEYIKQLDELEET